MNYNGYENVHSNGKVKDPHKPVKDSYGTNIPSSSINEAGLVIQPGSALDNDWDIDDDDDASYPVNVAPTPVSIKIIIAFVLIPVILHRLFDALIPLMQTLLVPVLIILFGITFIMPHVKKEMAGCKPEHEHYDKKKKKYRNIWGINVLFAFAASYPAVSPVLYAWTESVADLFAGNKSVLVSVFAVVLLVLLYFIRFLAAMLIIPFIQQLLWRFAGKFFENQTAINLAKRYMN
ncbi:hypothetical protein BK139_04820 [Paenibacillus sp. FSL R5-0490]|uniref:hypothetical protein n=1 Tax=Bacillales TaxID=1385 RepID=UPI00096FB846|nr:hypothetical protein [Paenibacillus sp. FSL R5-0490]OMF62152.1 hypothetical protein BK139_04820 [Paenibacillus sp. FSL R5-0490]